MRRVLTLFLVAFMAMGTGLAFAEEHGVEQEDRDGLTGDLYRISEIAEFGIMGQADEQIGDIGEAVLTLEGRVTHLIVNLSDAQGVEDGSYLVPLDSIRIYDTENMTLDLQRAEEFQRYENDTAAQGAHQLPEGTVRSSELLGWDVVGPRDERIAGMGDMVVDLGTGQLVYVTITAGGFLGIGREYYAVSFDQVQVVVAEEQTRLDITEDELDRMVGFDTDNWPAQGQDTTMLDTEDGEAAEDEEVADDQEARDDRDGLTGNLYRISAIADFGIVGQADEQIGNTIEPALTLEGQVTHLIAHLYDLESLDDGAYLVPWNAVSLYDSENLSIDVSRIQEFARFYDARSPMAGGLDGTSAQVTTAGQDPLDTTRDPNTLDDPAMAPGEQLPEGTVRASEFLGYDVVVGPGDDVIADIEDVVVDLETAEVEYVAIGSGGFLGIGRNYYAISFDRVEVEVVERRVRVDMTEEDFAQLEGFDYGDWPNEGGGRRLSTTRSTDEE